MRTLIALALTGTMIGTSMTAFAHPGWRHDNEYRHRQRARVMEVVPVTRLVRVAIPRTVCAQQPVRTRAIRRGDDGAALVGGIVGGIIGHNIGHGRRGSTVAGAIVGAAVGQSLTSDRRESYETVTYRSRCVERTRYEMRRTLVGYDVTYRFHGRLYTTRMQHRPGRFIHFDRQYADRDD